MFISARQIFVRYEVVNRVKRVDSELAVAFSKVADWKEALRHQENVLKFHIRSPPQAERLVACLGSSLSMLIMFSIL